MLKKRLLILLCFIVALPLLVYTSYEITSLNENEKLIEEIYRQQMNLILNSVNKNTREKADEWTKKIENILIGDEKSKNQKLDKFLATNKFIKNISLIDTNLVRGSFYMFRDSSRTQVFNSLKENKNIIERLLSRKLLGYNKIEAFKLYSENNLNKQLFLISYTQLNNNESKILGVLIDINLFIENIVKPNLLELARNEFVIAVFQKNDLNPVYSTSQVETYRVELNRRIWLLPDYYIGIALKGNQLEELAQSRFTRSLILIGLLTIVMIIAVVYLFRNFVKEIQLIKMRSDFVSNVSHELRTPLALIRMFAETIELGRTENEDEVKDYCRIIGNESERLTLLINRILDFSKIEAGQKKYSRQIVDINSVLENLIRLYSYHLKSKGFELKTNLDNKSLAVLGDKNSIYETVINLLDNAVKYSDKEKIVLLRSGSKKETVYIEVEDQGIGIAEKDHKKIFEKFYRIENSLISKTTGNGLGLSLVKHIMQAHNGEIKVISQPGKGSTFRLEFPIYSGKNQGEL